MAIKGGWMKDVKIKSWHYNGVFAHFIIKGLLGDFEWKYTWQEFTSDPLFWQSLGKVMGWEKCDRCGFPREEHLGGKMILCVAPKGVEGITTTADLKTFRRRNWYDQWHKFIDSLAEGKTAEDYFKSLN